MSTTDAVDSTSAHANDDVLYVEVNDLRQALDKREKDHRDVFKVDESLERFKLFISIDSTIE